MKSETLKPGWLREAIADACVELRCMRGIPPDIRKELESGCSEALLTDRIRRRVKIEVL